MNEDELCLAQKNEYERDLNTIRINEGNEYGFRASIVFESEQEAISIYNRIPKSYKMRLCTIGYPSLGIRKPFLDVSISYVPNKTTGKINEAGRIRTRKIKTILQQLLPHYRVTTTLYVPVPGYRNRFSQHRQFEGWV